MPKRPIKETKANSADPDQMPQNTASDQTTVFAYRNFYKNEIEITKHTRHP